MEGMEGMRKAKLHGHCFKRPVPSRDRIDRLAKVSSNECEK